MHARFLDANDAARLVRCHERHVRQRVDGPPPHPREGAGRRMHPAHEGGLDMGARRHYGRVHVSETDDKKLNLRSGRFLSKAWRSGVKRGGVYVRLL